MTKAVTKGTAQGDEVGHVTGTRLTQDLAGRCEGFSFYSEGREETLKYFAEKTHSI